MARQISQSSVDKDIRLSLRAAAVALLYAVTLAALPLDSFLDRANYLVYAEDSHTILARYWAQGVISFLSNEPIWIITNISLREFLSAEWVLRSIIFAPAFVVAYVTLRQDSRNFFWLLLFLLSVQVLKNHVVHLRQGYAIALFLAGWLSHRKKIRWSLMIASAFVHSSFVIILLLWIALHIASFLRISPYLQIVIAILLGGVIGAALPQIADAVGARQSEEYDFSAASVSGIGFIYWLGIFLLFLSSGRKFVAAHAFPIATIAFYLATYFQVEVTARIFESTILLVLLSGLDLRGWRKQSFFLAILCYTVFQYAQRAGLPYLGWGA